MAALDQVLTAAQMQAAEQALIDQGISVAELMERAGRGAADWVWRMAAGRKVTVLCGPGNNGDDGYVIARVLAERGLSVEVVAPMPPTTEAAKAAYKAWGKQPVTNAEGDVLVDCLFGTGLQRALSEDLLELLSGLTVCHDQIIAVDLSSGIDSDSGAALNDGLPSATLTLALGSWKRAHWLMPAMAQMGNCKLIDIGIDAVEGAAHLTQGPKLSAPSPDAHKYTRGLVAVVGGAMPGASIMASMAAMRGGAGYVKLLASKAIGDVPHDLVLDQRSLQEALSEERIRAILIGPGLARGTEAQCQLDHALAAGLPMVIDADALTLLKPEMIAQRSTPLIATPHPGEFLTLCQTFGIDTSNRVSACQNLANAMQATVISKGPDTIIASPEQPLTFIPPAPSWLSIAGTGDILAGLCASQLATGKAPHNAAVAATMLHGEAARIAGPAFAASDLINHIPSAYAHFL